MYYNQQSIDLFLAWYDSQPVCTVKVFTINLYYLQVLAMYKKVLSQTFFFIGGFPLTYNIAWF